MDIGIRRSRAAVGEIRVGETRGIISISCQGEAIGAVDMGCRDDPTIAKIDTARIAHLANIVPTRVGISCAPARGPVACCAANIIRGVEIGICARDDLDRLAAGKRQKKRCQNYHWQRESATRGGGLYHGWSKNPLPSLHQESDAVHGRKTVTSSRATVTDFSDSL